MPEKRLPLFLSRLPTAASLMPYLQEIDANRRHANFGPLAERLAQRLAAHFGLPEKCVTLTANGSLGLLHGLAAVAEPGGLCALPAWTYAATAAAAATAGLKPWFLDVDETTWALDPARIEAALGKAPGPVSAVLVVAPFGSPADTDAWQAFTGRTGVPVVIDAANGFDSLTPGRTPAMVSLHATKTLGIGEGGFVACRDSDLITRVRGLSNHGFTRPGRAGLRGINAKLSEYAAAVGLAALADWPATRVSYANLTRTYRRAIEDVPGLGPVPGDDGDWVTSTFNVLLPVGADPVIEALDKRGIEARRWWSLGCHRQPAYADCPRGAGKDDLPVTDSLADRVLGLPFFLGLGEDDVGRVRAALAAALAEASPAKSRRLKGG